MAELKPIIININTPAGMTHEEHLKEIQEKVRLGIVEHIGDKPELFHEYTCDSFGSRKRNQLPWMTLGFGEAKKLPFWSDPKVVGKTPIITTFLLEGANIGQLWRIWSQQSSLGQNPWSWVLVNMALLLWLNFYRVITPKEKFAIWATAIGVCLNAAVIFSVFWFQAHGR